MNPADRIAIHTLRAEGLSHRAIARELGCNRETVRYHLNKEAEKQRAIDVLYPLDGVKLPLETISGTMWFMPIKPPVLAPGQSDPCSHCPLEMQCREHVAQGDFMACERPLKKEVVE